MSRRPVNSLPSSAGTSMALPGFRPPGVVSWRIPSCLSSNMSYALGVQKETMLPEDMSVLKPTAYRSSSIVKPSPYKPPKCAECAPLLKAYTIRATAILVNNNYGIYVWGDSWISAKTQLPQLGLDPADPLHGPLKAASRLPGPNSYPPVIVLDIEGTTTPISFVTDVLFPYARDNVGKHLRETYDSKETQDDIELLRQQVKQDLNECVAGAKPIPSKDAPKDDVIAAVEANVLAMIDADRKITALKQLQGHIWRTGFTNGELQGQVFDDVPRALSQWHGAGTKTYIYSSGSREAQRQIFGHTNHGNLQSYLSGYFDTVTGNKREAQSYREIFLSVGVDDPSQITFATDVLAEAVAAKQAGLEAVLLLRPGNAPLPKDHGFRTVESLLDI